MKYIILLLSLIGCGENNTTEIEDLKGLGYKVFYCDRIEYKDYKSDISEDPYYKIYGFAEKDESNTELLSARCFDEDNCEYEMIKSKEVVCQKFVVASDDLIPYWDEHTLLVYKLKKSM
jgi:hypothetical protein|tara:strand:- start:547 stop:903 length:357 start_codon:yes stop_codon:yes gene_type:complete